MGIYDIYIYNIYIPYWPISILVSIHISPHIYVYIYICIFFFLNMSQSWWITVEWDVAWTASVRTPGRGHGGVGAVVFRRCRSGHGCVWGAKTHGIQTEKWGIHGEIMVKPSETKWNHEIINFISAVSWFLSKSSGQVVPKNWLLDAALLEWWLRGSGCSWNMCHHLVWSQTATWPFISKR